MCYTLVLISFNLLSISFVFYVCALYLCSHFIRLEGVIKNIETVNKDKLKNRTHRQTNRIEILFQETIFKATATIEREKSCIHLSSLLQNITYNDNYSVFVQLV